jgi:hypothetical protein
MERLAVGPAAAAALHGQQVRSSGLNFTVQPTDHCRDAVQRKWCSLVAVECVPLCRHLFCQQTSTARA